MTKRTENGYGIRRTALHVADACVANAKLIAALVDDVLDNAPENINVLRDLNELSRSNMAIFEVQGKIADGQLLEAELLAEGLGSGQKGQKKGMNRSAKGAPKQAVKP